MVAVLSQNWLTEVAQNTAMTKNISRLINENIRALPKIFKNIHEFPFQREGIIQKENLFGKAKTTIVTV